MIVDAIWEAAIRKSVREQMHKVSFGGDRSEAGRYAANMRWKGNIKTEVKTPLTPMAPDITKELKKYFGGTQTSHRKSEGWKEVNRRKIEKQTQEDFYLEIIAEKQGFAGKPTVVSSKEMDQLEKEGWTIAYRGLTDIYNEEEGTVTKSEDLAKQFLYGDYYAGNGSSGNGTYAAIDKKTAEGYARTDTEGTVIKIAIPPNSIMTVEQFAAEVKVQYEKRRNPDRVVDFYHDIDVGRYFAAKGFRGARTRNISSPDDIFVIWDRSMLAVQELDTVK